MEIALSDIPENVDNCINYCPKDFLIRTSGNTVVKKCIEGQCPGPVVTEHFTPLSDLEIKDGLSRRCGLNPDMSVMYTHISPESIESDPLTQQELRERVKY